MSTDNISIGVSQAKLLNPCIEPALTVDNRPGFVVRGTGSERQQLDHLLDHLNGLVQLGAKILVFPELTVPSNCLNPLGVAVERAWRKGGLPLLAVLGSSHRIAISSFENVAVVYSIKGNEAVATFGPVVEVIKNQPFEFPEKGLPVGYEHLAGTLEAIDGDRKVQLLDTPIGRICVLICKDAISDTTQQHIEMIRPEIILVPAMSESVMRFRVYGKYAAVNYGATMVVANSAQWVGTQKDNSFVTNPEMQDFICPIETVNAFNVQNIRSRYRVRQLKR